LTTIDTEQAFLTMVNENQGIIHKICQVYTNNPADKEDLFQEIVIQLWKSYGTFRGEAKFSTWMYRIALNTAISDIRKKERKVKIIFPEVEPKELADDNTDKGKEEQMKLLFKAIAQLSELEKAIVMLYLEEKSYEEMEEILGISNGNLRVKMNRIKDKLRTITKEEAYGT
jgi:RNA polymerase sigma-70 factor (ECF subfamily)